jgi:hypothetical protein
MAWDTGLGIIAAGTYDVDNFIGGIQTVQMIFDRKKTDNCQYNNP